MHIVKLKSKTQRSTNEAHKPSDFKYALITEENPRVYKISQLWRSRLTSALTTVWHVDQLLGNNREIRDYTTAVARKRSPPVDINTTISAQLLDTTIQQYVYWGMRSQIFAFIGKSLRDSELPWTESPYVSRPHRQKQCNRIDIRYTSKWIIFHLQGPHAGPLAPIWGTTLLPYAALIISTV
jgi:hypothetical protein